MDHERVFFEAIREAPHDDAPRLIYADWLEEQGGAARTARAHFIRIQCRLAELPEDDPARD
ncbi:MAG: TIGR02996 domain-containing protein, partial [Gemmataceae bacterium]